MEVSDQPSLCSSSPTPLILCICNRMASESNWPSIARGAVWPNSKGYHPFLFFAVGVYIWRLKPTHGVSQFAMVAVYVGRGISNCDQLSSSCYSILSCSILSGMYHWVIVLTCPCLEGLDELTVYYSEMHHSQLYCWSSDFHSSTCLVLVPDLI